MSPPRLGGLALDLSIVISYALSLGRGLLFLMVANPMGPIVG